MPSPGTLLTSELPAVCLVVWRIRSTFVVELRLKRQVREQYQCDGLASLVRCITQVEMYYLAHRQTLLTYLLHGPTQRCQLLSYEQACELATIEE